MDEATSALDAENELLVVQSLENLIKNRTCIIIAHQENLMKLADKVALLQVFFLNRILTKLM